jgi:hypothetical protein
MNARVYLLTEGVHDVYFLYKILRTSFGFSKVETLSELDEEWRLLLPTFPHEGSLRASVPAPTFCRGGDTWVAMVNADGIERLEKRLKRDHKLLAEKGFGLDAVGVVLDADFEHAKQKKPEERFAQIADAIARLGLPRPQRVEEVSGTPRTGVFVLPGAGALGTLEDLLLECAAVVYPTLGCRAVRFVDGLDHGASDFKRRDLEEIGKPTGRNKAVLAAMGAVLKPGKPIQASLEDHRWIEPRTLALPRVAAVLRFLAELTGAAPSTSAAQ